MKLTTELTDKIQKQVNQHFGVEIGKPKIRVITDPQKFFNFYTGIKKERSISELMDLDGEVSYYYDDEVNAILFKGFRRNGLKSFKKLKDQTVKLEDLTHEWIHHIQVMSGGYGDYDFFEEACNEVCNFVLVGHIDVYSVYWDYVVRIWNFMDSMASTIGKKYRLIRDYNTSSDKQALHNEWMDTFISYNKKVASNKKSLINTLEYDGDLDGAAYKALYARDTDSVKQDLYKLHDFFRPELLRLFH